MRTTFFAIIAAVIFGNAYAAPSAVNIDDLEVGDITQDLIMIGSNPIPLASGEWRVIEIEDTKVKNDGFAPQEDAASAVLEHAGKPGIYLYISANVDSISTHGWHTSSCDKNPNLVFFGDISESYSFPECFKVYKTDPKGKTPGRYIVSYHYHSSSGFATITYLFPQTDKNEFNNDYLSKLTAWAKEMAQSAHTTVSGRKKPVLPPSFDFSPKT